MGMTDETRFPCPSCGADLRFDPSTGGLTCDFCGHTEDASTLAAPPAIRELDFERAIATQLSLAEMEDTRIAKCPKCGAETAFDPEVHASECPFCASPVVVDTGRHRQIKPAAVLPFRLNEAEARYALKKWLGSVWFAPNGLQKYARTGRAMSGVYLPHWTFDAKTRSTYDGKRGIVRRRRNSDGSTDTYTSWSRTSGRVARDFDDVVVAASPSIEAGTEDAIAPWDMSALVPYSPDFLAGFRAEGYRIGLEEGRSRAQVKMDAIIARDVRMDIGGDRQVIDRLDTEISDVTFKHILLPIWIAAYTYRGKSFRVVVNGSTGRATGDHPISAWKVAGAVAVAIVLAAAFFYANNM